MLWNIPRMRTQNKVCKPITSINVRFDTNISKHIVIYYSKHFVRAIIQQKPFKSSGQSVKCELSLTKKLHPIDRGNKSVSPHERHSRRISEHPSSDCNEQVTVSMRYVLQTTLALQYNELTALIRDFVMPRAQWPSNLYFEIQGAFSLTERTLTEIRFSFSQ